MLRIMQYPYEVEVYNFAHSPLDPPVRYSYYELFDAKTTFEMFAKLESSQRVYLLMADADSTPRIMRSSNKNYVKTHEENESGVKALVNEVPCERVMGEFVWFVQTCGTPTRKAIQDCDHWFPVCDRHFATRKNGGQS